MKDCVGVFGILAGPSQGHKNLRRGEDNKRWEIIKDGGGGGEREIASNDVFVLRVGEVNSDERQVEEIPIIVMIANRPNKIRGGSQ